MPSVSAPPPLLRARLLALVALGFAVLTLPAFRQDDLDCEQAVAHLKSCCAAPFNPSSFDCTYATGCGSTVNPQFTTSQSACIEALDCPTINSSGLCTAGTLSPAGTSFPPAVTQCQ